jgi:putative FmdB family regulatory protein
MPTYEYACRDCGRNIEVVQSFTDDPLETCPHCGGRLRKVFSAAGIIFKGSGYYVTDTRSERRRSSSSGSSSGGKDSSSTTSGDSSDSSDSSTTSSSASSSSDAKSA